LENLCFHFDGKRIDNKEYQVLDLKNELKEVKLEALVLPNGKAKIVLNEITDILYEYKLWKSLKIIVTDTTNINTGINNEIATQLQKLYAEKKLEKPQFIGCQHHIHERVLRLSMDSEFGEKSTSPNIEYPFIQVLLSVYEKLKMQFTNVVENIKKTKRWIN